jgi:hypothetical protein
MEGKGMTEKEMREAEVPWPENIKELTKYIGKLVDQKHDYGTCVYAMSMAATAAFYYVSHKLGVTGFQASCADLDIIRRTRHIEGPFAMIDAHDMLYPQSDIMEKVQKYLSEWKSWAGKEAEKLLASNKETEIHPNVWAHWKRLSAVNQAEGGKP